ncbi:hypothetical protein N1851_022263 [Merluccius polli]|uniref:Uncharacterized protein n=1 Tax=Merluccius polli TaxID=89951 RepID=A0AA47MIM7_MERPO|nr:hypothetical protein N1851_022263 [Merluccius polli]
MLNVGIRYPRSAITPVKSLGNAFESCLRDAVSIRATNQELGAWLLAFKAWIYRHGVLPRPLWPLLTSTVEGLERRVRSGRKWKAAEAVEVAESRLRHSALVGTLECSSREHGQDGSKRWSERFSWAELWKAEPHRIKFLIQAVCDYSTEPLQLAHLGGRSGHQHALCARGEGPWRILSAAARTPWRRGATVGVMTQSSRSSQTPFAAKNQPLQAHAPSEENHCFLQSWSEANSSFQDLLLRPALNSTRLGAGVLTIPTSRLSTIGARAFSCTAPRLRDALPPHIQQSDTITAFKSHLKTHLLNS